MSKENKIKEANKLYIQRIALLMNRAKELYKEKDFFAAYGLSLIINRLLESEPKEILNG